MRKTVASVLVLALVAGACGSEGGADAEAISTTKPGSEPIEVRLRLIIADTEGAEVPATGEVLDGSTLGNEPFCVGGTTEDRHASEDPAMEPHGLLDRTITCADGTVRMGFTPGRPTGLTQGGSWTIVSGTGAYQGLRGSGEMEVTYDPDDDSLAHETLTGIVTR